MPGLVGAFRQRHPRVRRQQAAAVQGSEAVAQLRFEEDRRVGERQAGARTCGSAWCHMFSTPLQVDPHEGRPAHDTATHPEVKRIHSTEGMSERAGTGTEAAALR